MFQYAVAAVLALISVAFGFAARVFYQMEDDNFLWLFLGILAAWTFVAAGMIALV